MKDIIETIDSLHMEDLKNKNHPSIFDENEFYNLLIIRLPILLNDDIQFKSLGFIITKNKTLYFDKENNTFLELEGHFQGLHNKIDLSVNKLLKRFSKYQDQIDLMEDNLYEHVKHQNFNTQWLGFKSDILRIERVLLRTSATVKDMYDYYKEDENFNENSFSHIYEHLERVLRSATFQLTKLDYLFNFRNTQTNEKMNEMVYALTVISAIFLPLNLAVGFFGMNTSSLPFTTGVNGTWQALTFMSIFLVAAVIVFSFIKRKFT